MATTAKQSSSTTVSSSRGSSSSPTRKTSSVGGQTSSSQTGPSNYIDGEEDIETIAKQISDHAEAIYQTWKARGLAPTEILNCHTGNSDAFGKSLTPTTTTTTTQRYKDTSPVAELLAQAPDMSNNNLEKLVSSFVNEDKARQQAARKSNILTSGTIKDVLRKFESPERNTVKPNFLRNSTSPQPPSSLSISAAAAATTTTPTNAYTTNTKTQRSPSPQKSTTSSGLASSSSSSSSLISSVSTPTTPNNIVNNKLNKNVPDVLMNTIEQNNNNNNNNNVKESSPPKQQKPETPAKPASLINHTPSWPLKNRLGNTSPGSGAGGGGGGVGNINNNNNNISVNNNSNNISSGISNNVIIKKDVQIKNITTVGGVNNNNNTSIKIHKTSGGGGNSDNSEEVIKLKKSTEKLKKSVNLMDEVLMEEERLINALKTGTVLQNNIQNSYHLNNNNNNNDNDKILPEVITSTLINDHKLLERNWTKPDISTATMMLPSSQTSSINNNNIIINNSNNSDSVNHNSSNKISWNDEQQTTINHVIDMPPKQITIQSQSGEMPMTPGSASTTAGGGGGMNSAATIKIINKSPRPRNDAAVPHPDNVNKNSNANNANGNPRTTTVNPVRPFLTRGSVAERVLMFEKCPEVKALRNVPKEPSKLTTKPQIKPNIQTHTTLQRHIRGSKNIYIPRFHFPHGKPLSSISVETTLQRLQAAFDSFPNNQVSKENFSHILKICSLPLYWRMPLFHCTQLTPSGLIDGYKFCDFWKQMSVFCHDTTSRFVFILSHGQRSRPYILPEDLITMVQDVVDTHPGLAFLKEASEFHSRYVHTVIARIFYAVNRSWSGKITLPELRRSNLLQVIQLLEEEEDINQIMAYFSYEHFYVIYCKFWELDRDHDLFIDQNDLARHNDHALSTRIIERIFSGCVTRGSKTRNQSGTALTKMSYTEFVWFLLSEEDKTHPTAVEYWFRCMDLDGDGILSMYELEYFYEEQQHRMESIGIETLPFEDCLCQMLDMIKPLRPGMVTLGDLKRCKMTPIFYDTFFNLEKYMEHEQRDPFATQRDQDDMTDWDRYAATEYELLVAEEGGDTQGSYEDDEDDEDDVNAAVDDNIDDDDDDEDRNDIDDDDDVDDDDEEEDAANYKSRNLLKTIVFDDCVIKDMVTDMIKEYDTEY